METLMEAADFWLEQFIAYGIALVLVQLRKKRA